MSYYDKNRAILSIQIVASVAKKLASDLEQGKLWGGDATYQLGIISTNLRDAIASIGDQDR